MENRLPSWFRQELKTEPVLGVAELLRKFSVQTVCQQAHCPNLNSCFSARRVAFLLLGDTCTRQCAFCAVRKNNGSHLGLDVDEPRRVAEASRQLGAEYVILTSVSRDDLEDAGAGIFAATIKYLKRDNPNVKIETLIPDFNGSKGSLKMVLESGVDVLAHNIETSKRLYPLVRPQADYQRSLDVLKTAKKINPAILTKSSLLLGMGESKGEVILTLQDLRSVSCDIVVLGQYLAPSPKHKAVEQFIDVAQFKEYSKIGFDLGFKKIYSHPLARTSHKAQEVFYDASCV